MIFIDNKYTRWYYNIVANATARNLKGKQEHHQGFRIISIPKI